MSSSASRHSHHDFQFPDSSPTRWRRIAFAFLANDRVKMRMRNDRQTKGNPSQEETRAAGTARRHASITRRLETVYKQLETRRGTERRGETRAAWPRFTLAAEKQY